MDQDASALAGSTTSSVPGKTANVRKSGFALLRYFSSDSNRSVVFVGCGELVYLEDNRVNFAILAPEHLIVGPRIVLQQRVRGLIFVAGSRARTRVREDR